MKKGAVYTIAGDGSPGFSGDGGPARKAEVAGPLGIAVDHSGNAVITRRPLLRAPHDRERHLHDCGGALR
ncbi:MAG TPA: hypothetical protein VFQ44_20880 [Streptosporangiaceae bacterium]|nr:hypothetical protein [Streptosporangiaceae bacterium]